MAEASPRARTTMDYTSRIDAFTALKHQPTLEVFLSFFDYLPEEETRKFYYIYSSMSTDELNKEIERAGEERHQQIEEMRQAERKRQQKIEMKKLRVEEMRLAAMQQTKIGEKFSVMPCPSSLKINDEKVVAKKERGVICCNIALVETQISLYAKHEANDHIAMFAKLLMQHMGLHQNESYGPRKKGQQPPEIVLSSIFSAALQHCQSTIFNVEDLFPPVIWCHQMKVEGGYMDICGYQRLSRGWKPRVVWEFSVDSSDKEGQMFGYVNNLDSQTEDENDSLFVIGIIVVIASTPTIEMKAYYKAKVGDRGYKLAVVDMWSALLSDKSLSTVLQAIHCWMHFANTSVEGVPAPILHQRNVIIYEGTVTKVFDYRKRSVDAGDKRNHLSSLMFIPDCKPVVETDDLVIIRYPFIDGTHLPSSLKQVKGVLQHLENIHEDGYIHMDIRASNLVFSSNGGQLIDFDFCSPAQAAKYPSNYRIDISDGRRHSGVECGGKGEAIHDSFALATVLRLCSPVTKKYGSHWNTICTKIESGLLKDALKMVQDHAVDYSLSTKCHVESGVGTGSPPKKSVDYAEEIGSGVERMGLENSEANSS